MVMKKSDVKQEIADAILVSHSKIDRAPLKIAHKAAEEIMKKIEDKTLIAENTELVFENGRLREIYSEQETKIATLRTAADGLAEALEGEIKRCSATKGGLRCKDCTLYGLCRYEKAEKALQAYADVGSE